MHLLASSSLLACEHVRICMCASAWVRVDISTSSSSIFNCRIRQARRWNFMGQSITASISPQNFILLYLLGQLFRDSWWLKCDNELSHENKDPIRLRRDGRERGQRRGASQEIILAHAISPAKAPEVQQRVWTSSRKLFKLCCWAQNYFSKTTSEIRDCYHVPYAKIPFFKYSSTSPTHPPVAPSWKRAFMPVRDRSPMRRIYKNGSFRLQTSLHLIHASA